MSALDLPSWPLLRLKVAVRRIVNGGTPGRREDYWGGGIPWVTPGDVSRSPRLLQTARTLTPAGLEACSAQLSPAGSVVITGRAPVGNVSLARTALSTSQGCKTLIPDERRVLAPYLQAALWVQRGEVDRRANGTTFAEISSQALAQVPLPMPPLRDQRLIVRYLNHRTLDVETAKASKRALVRLLIERREQIVRELVLGRNELYSRTRHVGIDSVGAVPDRWHVARAKYFYREVNDRSITGTETSLSISHLTGVTPRSAKNVTMFRAASYVGHKVCQPGDLVINTMWAWMGALGTAHETGLVSPAYGVYRPVLGSGLSPDYADLLLRTRPYIAEYTRRSTGIRASRLRLYADKFLTVPLICPPADEQSAIVEQVRRATGGLDQAVQFTLKEVDLLDEFYGSLTRAAVLGHVDVRVHAARMRDVEDSELDAVVASVTPDDAGEDDSEEG